MAKKTWAGYAASRKNRAGEWECVTKPDPSTALNPARLEYLKGEAEKVGLLTEIRPLVQGKRPMGLFVCYPEKVN
jgi:hypothetical protein